MSPLSLATKPRSSPPELITQTSEWDVKLPAWLKHHFLCQQELLAHPELTDLKNTAEILPNLNQKEDHNLICRAFQFAYSLHQGQMRASGEPYIAHPIAVAGILRDLGGSPALIASGFLHDVVEDTDITVAELETVFGSEIARLVDGVTKLSKFNFSSKTERQAENFRRMFVAMAKDIRVIIVKLADRLHNMRTLEHLPPEKRVLIALETREIFAPLANRLGIGQIKWALEDLAFKYLEPEAYKEIKTLIADKRIDREERINSAIQRIQSRLRHAKINPIEVSGRPKHLYSIYRKMQTQNKQFNEIYDVAAVRIITEDTEECYRALAIVHDLFRPVPGRFKDYIGLPKPNHYQSLHTTVIGLSGRPMEVQIRTQEMHYVAEYGIAAHWKYKESAGSTPSFNSTDEKFSWLRQLVDWQTDFKDDHEYLESIKNNLFDEDVYVFTPQGDVVSLPRYATPIDFAYRIHTEVGHHCAGAKVNDRISPLDTHLKNGDIVEIICQKNAHPSLDWINFVVSSSAKNRIRQWFKRFHRDENILRAREMLEKELGKTGLDALLKSQPLTTVAERCNYTSVEDLLAGLGYGEITLNAVVNRIREAVRQYQQAALPPLPPESNEDVLRALVQSHRAAAPASSSQTPILGIEGLVYKLAGCCSPLPGEPIIASIALGGHGLSIHRQGCSNIDGIPGDRLIPVSWNTEEQKGRAKTYPVRLRLEVIDRVGVLRDVLNRLIDQSINVNNANVSTTSNRPARIDLCLDIANHRQLCQLSAQLKKMSDVLSVTRLGAPTEETCEIS
jgi:RelA/SpoT family (p)ppGpp synthetase